MDYQNYNNYQNYQNQPIPPKKNSPNMETLALALGVIAIVSSTCVYPSFICGSLGIILAIISRGGEASFSPKAKAALGVNIAALILITVLLIVSLIIAFTVFGGVDNMIKFSQEMQNMDYQEIYQRLYELMYPAQ